MCEEGLRIGDIADFVCSGEDGAETQYGKRQYRSENLQGN
jgi:hypothetical protein